MEEVIGEGCTPAVRIVGAVKLCEMHLVASGEEDISEMEVSSQVIKIGDAFKRTDFKGEAQREHWMLRELLDEPLAVERWGCGTK